MLPTVFPMLYVTPPWLTYFLTGSLYLWIPFIYCGPPPTPLLAPASNSVVLSPGMLFPSSSNGPSSSTSQYWSVSPLWSPSLVLGMPSTWHRAWAGEGEWRKDGRKDRRREEGEGEKGGMEGRTGISTTWTEAGENESVSSGEDPLEEEMATHSSVLAWRIPWTEEPGGLLGATKNQMRLSDLACAYEL